MYKNKKIQYMLSAKPTIQDKFRFNLPKKAMRRLNAMNKKLDREERLGKKKKRKGKPKPKD